jgi:MFS transporter, FSR family, fosmidomycin resistance protein
LQPLVGYHADQHPMPYSTAIGMIFTLVGLVSLSFATRYIMILVSVACIGIGSSIYHPEATRTARYASGNRQGLAQGIFQVGGQVGSALSPLLAALIIVPRGQTAFSWFASLAILAIVLMIGIGRQHTTIRTQFLAATSSHSRGASGRRSHSPAAVWLGLGMLSILMFSKLAYVESFRSFYTFYLIDRFGVSIATSQIVEDLVVALDIEENSQEQRKLLKAVREFGTYITSNRTFIAICKKRNPAAFHPITASRSELTDPHQKSR